MYALTSARGPGHCARRAVHRARPLCASLYHWADVHAGESNRLPRARQGERLVAGMPLCRTHPPFLTTAGLIPADPGMECPFDGSCFPPSSLRAWRAAGRTTSRRALAGTGSVPRQTALAIATARVFAQMNKRRRSRLCLAQAPRAWYTRVLRYLTSCARSSADLCA